MSHFPDTEEIRRQSNIVDVVSRYAELKNAGAGRLRACCPFHDEKTPSFYVYTDGHFKCFGCGKTGSVFDFVMGMEGVSFLDAKRILGGESPVLPTPTRPMPRFKPESERLNWREVEAVSGVVPLAGTPGQRYLESRGIPLETAVACGVRFARSWYRNASVLFDVRNQAGEVVAVQGRAICGKAKITVGPKTQGLFLTPGALDGNFAIAEGPMDAMSLHLLGVPAVAVCGSDLPPWLLDVVHDRTIFIASDNDMQGNADYWGFTYDRKTDAVALTGKGWADTLEAAGATVKRLLPPPGQDWNDVLKK